MLESNTSTTTVSFNLAQLITQKRNPHTIAEEAILPIAKIIIRTIIGNKVVKEIHKFVCRIITILRF